MARRISAIIRGGILVVLVAVPLIYSGRLQNSFGVPKQVFFQWAVAVLLLLFGVQAVLDPKRLAARATPADLPVLAWLAWIAVAAAFSMDRAASTPELISAASLAGLFLLVTRSVETRGQALALVAIVAAMGVAESAYGIAQRFGVKLFYESRVKEAVPSFDISSWRWEILGTFGNPNHLASYLALCCPVLLGGLGLRRPAARLASLAGLIVTLACLALTGARGSWAAASAGLVLPVAWALRRGRRSVIPFAATAALLLVAALAVVCVLQPRIGEELIARVTGSFSDSTGSMSYRMLGWKVSVRMVAARPLLGSGPGTFRLRFLPALAEYLTDRDPLSHWFLKEKMNEAHNEFLQSAVEEGIPGLLLFLCALAFIFRGILGRARAAEFPDGFFITSAAAGLAAVLVDAVSSIPFHIVPTCVAFWAVAGALLSWPAPGVAGKTSPESEGARPKPAWSWTVAGYLAVFSVVSLIHGYRSLVFDYCFKMATTLNYLQRMPEALSWFRRALDANPSSGQVRFYCGSTLIHLGRDAEGAALLEESKKNFQDIYLFKNLGIAYERMGRLDDAISQYERWRAMGIAAHEANNLIGLVRLRQGRPREAAEAFRETLRVRGWDITAYSNLAAILINGGRYEEAVAVLDPEPLWKTPDAYTIYGVALLKAGRHEEARRKFLRTLELDPRSVKARNNLGALLYLRGDLEGAAREWEEALRVDPGNVIAAGNIETVRRRLEEERAAASRWPFFSARSAGERPAEGTATDAAAPVGAVGEP